MANAIDTSITPDTQTLCDTLLAVPVNGQVTFNELSAKIGRPVQSGSGRGKLESALRIVKRDHGAWFENIRGVGYRRCAPDEAPRIGVKQRRHIGRVSKRAIRDMENVAAKSNGLSEDAKRRLSTEMATHGLMAHLAKDDTSEALAGNTEGKPTPVAVTAQNLLAHIGAR